MAPTGYRPYIQLLVAFLTAASVYLGIKTIQTPIPILKIHETSEGSRIPIKYDIQKFNDLNHPSENICIPHLSQHIIRTPYSTLPRSHRELFESAKERLRSSLDAYAATSNDTIAIVVVHSNDLAGEELFWWGKGPVKFNSTAGIRGKETVTRDSIFRIASLTKVFTVLEGLILQERSNELALHTIKGDQATPKPRLTMEDDIRLHLEGFTLPEPFKSEKITLNMLGGHLSGLPRDVSVYGVNFTNQAMIDYMPWDNKRSSHSLKSIQGNQHPLNMKLNRVGEDRKAEDNMVRISAPGKCRHVQSKNEDQEWHMCTKVELFELIKKTRLIWLPGEMVSYSNTGFDVLGWALQSFASIFEGGKEGSYLLRNLIHRDVFQPLEMGSSFFHPIPPHLKDHITVPKSDHMVDFDFGEAYDPAGGMYSTAADLSKFILAVLSKTPKLLNPQTIRSWLKPSFPLPNGLSSVGVPWEIESNQYPPSQGPVYQLYGKGGALPGHYSQISIIPELGYGVIALVSIGSEEKDIEAGIVKESNPNYLSSIVHDTLVEPLRGAYHAYAKETYSGTYVQHSPAPSVGEATGKAVIDVLEPNGILLLQSLVTSSNISLLHYLDSLNPGNPNVYASGGKLWSSSVEGEFRIRGAKGPETRPGRRGCREWFGFDEATTEEGWGVDKIVIRRYGRESAGANRFVNMEYNDSGSGGWELAYAPLGVVFRKADL